MSAAIPERLAEEIRVRETTGETVILVTEDPPGQILYLYVSAGIFDITGYSSEEIKRETLRVILPDTTLDGKNIKQVHDAWMLGALNKVRSEGPFVRIMGRRSDQSRSVSFIKKDGRSGSLVLPLFGYMIDGLPFVLGKLHEQARQVRRFDVPTSDALDALISYGRQDSPNQVFHKELARLLKQWSLDAWLDLNDIPLTEEFMRAIRNAIAKANTVIFVAAPYSVCSPYCAKELEIAREYGKDVLVILLKSTGTVNLSKAAWDYLYPELAEEYSSAQADGRNTVDVNVVQLMQQYQPALARENWLVWDEEKSFPVHIRQIVAHLNKDRERKKQHSELLLSALKWDKNGRSSQYLLSSKIIGETRNLIQNPGQCRITNLQYEFFSESSSIRASGFSDVFICCDPDEDAYWATRLRYACNAAALSVWDARGLLSLSQQGDDRAKAFSGMRRASNVIYLVSEASLNSSACQAQITYSLENNKPVYLVFVSVQMSRSSLPDYLQEAPLYDPTEDFDKETKRLRIDLAQHLEHKKVMAELLVEAEERWDKTTKTSLSKARLATAKVYTARGKRDRSLPSPSTQVEEMIRFSEKVRKPIWQIWGPAAFGGVAIASLIFFSFNWFRPIPIPDDLTEITDWDITPKAIEDYTGISQERIFQCTRTLKGILPAGTTEERADLEPVDGAYAFYYDWGKIESNGELTVTVTGRWFACQATVDETKGIPKWISLEPTTSDNIYKIQLLAHREDPSRCFAAMDPRVENKKLARSIESSLSQLYVNTLGIDYPWDPDSRYLEIMRRSLYGLIISCPFQTQGDAVSRGVGGYLAIAVREPDLTKITPEVLYAIAYNNANSLQGVMDLPPPPKLAQEETDHNRTIALFIKAKVISTEPMIVDDPVQQKWIEGIMSSAKNSNYEVKVFDLPCQDCFPDQVIALQNLVDQEQVFDGILFVGANTRVMGDILGRILAPLNDVPIISFDTPVESNRVLAHVGPDNKALGEKVGDWAADFLQEGTVAIVSGPDTQQNSIERTSGFKAAIAPYPELKLVAEGYGDWTMESGYEIAKGMLRSFPNINLFLCANDEMARGVSKALADEGLRSQKYKAGEPIVTGFDYGDESLIRNGVIDATISQGSEQQAILAFGSLFNFLESDTIPEDIMLDKFQIIVSPRIGGRDG